MYFRCLDNLNNFLLSTPPVDNYEFSLKLSPAFQASIFGFHLGDRTVSSRHV